MTAPLPAAGPIDNIVCKGGTGTAGALSLGYNELYKMNLPGAFNVLFLETDGLPNTLTMNFWDSTTNTYALDANSNCLDKNGKTRSLGGWWARGSARDWNNTGGHVMGPNGYMADIPAGAIGAIYSSDPNTSSPDYRKLHPDGLSVAHQLERRPQHHQGNQCQRLYLQQQRQHEY